MYEKILNGIECGLRSALNDKSYYHDIDALTYDQALGAIIEHDMINETYHVIDTFNDCVNDIIKRIPFFDKFDTVYSGWAFDIFKKQCVKLNEPIHKNNSTLPIYLNLVYDDSYICVMSSTDRKMSDDKIRITINYAKLKNVSELDAISILSHEFRHILEMYIDEKQSHIGDSLDTVYSDPILDNLPEQSRARIGNILNQFAKSEERARIDGTIHFIKCSDTNLDDTMYSESYKKVAYLVKFSKTHHMLYDMRNTLDYLYESIVKNRFRNVLIIGYLYNKYCENTEVLVNEEMIEEMEGHKEVAMQIYKYFLGNYNEFYRNLTDCIATHVVIGID